MGLFDWVFKIAFGKALNRGAKAGIAVVAAPTILGFLAQHGVNVTLDEKLLEASVVTGGLFVYEFARNWFSSKGFKIP